VRARGLGGLRKPHATIPTSATDDVAAKNATAGENDDADAPAAPASSALDATASPLGKRHVDPAAKVSPPKKQSVEGAGGEEKGGATCSAPAPAPPRARRSLRSLSEEKEEEEEGEGAAAPPTSSTAAEAAAEAAAAASTGVPGRPHRRAPSRAAAAITFAPGVFSSSDDEDDGVGPAAAALTAARPARTIARSYLSSWAPLNASSDDDGEDARDSGAEFRVGDFAYVLLDESLPSQEEEEEEEDGARAPSFADGDNCVACGKGHKPLPGSQQKQKQQLDKKRGGRAAATAAAAAAVPSSGSGEEEEGAEGEADEAVPIIECSACLAGYHLDCLDPPLEAVPEAEWLCPPCERGETAEKRRASEEASEAAAAASAAPAAPHFAAVRSALAPARPRTLRERFMAGQLGLVRIDALWRERTLLPPRAAKSGSSKKKSGGGGRGGEGKGERREETVRFRGPWLLLPEETHTGRRRGHGAREVFLSSHSSEHDAGSLVAVGFAAARPASKPRPSPSRSPPSPCSPVSVVAEDELASTPGDDVYFCRYEYNAGFRSFRALGAAGAALERAEKAGKGKKKKKGRKSSADDGRDADGASSGASSSSSDDDDSDPADRDFRLRQPDLFDAWSRAGLRVARPASHSKGRAATRRSSATAAAAKGPRTDGKRSQPRQGGGDDDVVVAALAGKLAAASAREAGQEVEDGEAARGERPAPAPLPAPPRPSASHAGRPSALARARAALAPSADHCGLPCRDEERARLDAFIRGAAEDGGATSGRCLYVYGVPGTGKTASVLDAVKRASAASSPSAATSAKNSKTAKNSTSPVRPFRFVEINALRLPTPKHVYCRLLEAMWGERASPAAAHDLLNARIGAAAAPARRGAAAKCKAKEKGGEAPRKTGATRKKSRNNDGDFDSDEENEPDSSGSETEEGEGEEIDEEGIATIVLVDEMDLLVTRNQTVLYNLFEWPARPHSGLAVIGVANTMDLPDRLLPRIASRFGSARLPFAPYGPAQLREIVEARLRASGGERAFEPRAVLYATRKVAAMAGDVRRALELCRMAADVAADEAREERREKKGKGKKKGDDDSDDDNDGVFDCCGSASPSDSSNITVVVSMRHVDAAVRAMFGAAHMQALSAAPLVDVLLLASLALELKASGRAAATVADLHPRVAELFASGGLLPQGSPPPSLGDVAASASRLAAQRILVADAGDARARARVAFDVPVADVLAALLAQRGATAFVARLPYV